MCAMFEAALIALFGAVLASPAPASPPPADRSGPCLECHDTARRIHWPGSRHERHGVTCESCHLPHGEGQGPSLLRAVSEAETCFACHGQVRSRGLRTSRHPVRDGALACSSCHAPHGSANDARLSRPTATEACVDCHAEKRGPFLW
jgi:DmsE family decaheme c-type cytochrome